MNKMYRVEAYAKNGYCVFLDECKAESMEEAIEIFARVLINIQEEDPDFDEEIAYAILDAMRDRFTVTFSRSCAERGPVDVEYDFTNIYIQLDID
jgi:hypothetical protein